MNCLMCGSRIKNKITIQNFFLPNKEEICYTCRQKYPLYQEVIVIPIDYYLMYIINLTDCEVLEHMPYLKEGIKQYLRQSDKDMILMIEEKMNLHLIELIEKLSFGNVMILTTNYKGEMIYEV